MFKRGSLALVSAGHPVGARMVVVTSQHRPGDRLEVLLVNHNKKVTVEVTAVSYSVVDLNGAMLVTANGMMMSPMVVREGDLIFVADRDVV